MCTAELVVDLGAEVRLAEARLDGRPQRALDAAPVRTARAHAAPEPRGDVSRLARAERGDAPLAARQLGREARDQLVERERADAGAGSRRLSVRLGARIDALEHRHELPLRQRGLRIADRLEHLGVLRAQRGIERLGCDRARQRLARARQIAALALELRRELQLARARAVAAQQRDRLVHFSVRLEGARVAVAERRVVGLRVVGGLQHRQRAGGRALIEVERAELGEHGGVVRRLRQRGLEREARGLGLAEGALRASRRDQQLVRAESRARGAPVGGQRLDRAAEPLLQHAGLPVGLAGQRRIERDRALDLRARALHLELARRAPPRLEPVTRARGVVGPRLGQQDQRLRIGRSELGRAQQGAARALGVLLQRKRAREAQGRVHLRALALEGALEEGARRAGVVARERDLAAGDHQRGIRRVAAQRLGRCAPDEARRLDRIARGREHARALHHVPLSAARRLDDLVAQRHRRRRQTPRDLAPGARPVAGLPGGERAARAGEVVEQRSRRGALRRDAELRAQRVERRGEGAPRLADRVLCARAAEQRARLRGEQGKLRRDTARFDLETRRHHAREPLLRGGRQRDVVGSAERDRDDARGAQLVAQPEVGAARDRLERRIRLRRQHAERRGRLLLRARAVRQQGERECERQGRGRTQDPDGPHRGAYRPSGRSD